MVVLWLLSLPFGKFFHIIQRPASIGVTLYQQVNQDVDHYRPEAGTPKGACARCGNEFPSAQFVTDLKGVINDLGQDYTMNDEQVTLQNFCPTCKRVMRGESYYALLGRRFV